MKRLFCLVTLPLALAAILTILWKNPADEPVVAERTVGSTAKEARRPSGGKDRTVHGYPGDEEDGGAEFGSPPAATLNAREERLAALALEKEVGRANRRQLYEENIARLDAAAEGAEATGNSEYAHALRMRSDVLSRRAEAEADEEGVAEETIHEAGTAAALSTP